MTASDLTNQIIAGSGGLNYTWILCESGDTLAIGPESTTTIEFGGLYQVIIDGDNCRNVTDCYFFTPTNVIDEVFNITLYPNPAMDRLRIASDRSYEVVEVINSLGRSMLIEVDQGSLGISSYASGMYFIKLRISDRDTVMPFLKM